MHRHVCQLDATVYGVTSDDQEDQARGLAILRQMMGTPNASAQLSERQWRNLGKMSTIVKRCLEEGSPNAVDAVDTLLEWAQDNLEV